jgi:membrane protease YdiL (CAAX protease family)
LALHPPDTAETGKRNEVLNPARTLLIGAIAGTVIAGIVGLAGFAGLITVVVLLFLGKLRNGLRDFSVHHGIYAETFALWMVLLFVMQLVAGYLGKLWPHLAMPIVLVGFFLSLTALVWPVLRGVPWQRVRHDIGWHGGTKAALQPLFGISGYVMGLPILAVGVAMTYVLLLIQQATAAPGPLFDPSGGPAHPIIQQLGGSDWYPKLMVLALGAIAAPIVEETMFRGVLYRHLRGATSHMGLALSIVVGALVNSFVFAIIHPQGWVAVPALMSLAIAFTLMREWRGSLIPSMMMHGISNFIVLTVLMLALSV